MTSNLTTGGCGLSGDRRAARALGAWSPLTRIHHGLPTGTSVRDQQMSRPIVNVTGSGSPSPQKGGDPLCHQGAASCLKTSRREMASL